MLEACAGALSAASKLVRKLLLLKSSLEAHFKDGHRVPYRDSEYIASGKVQLKDPCAFGLSETLAVAHRLRVRKTLVYYRDPKFQVSISILQTMASGTLLSWASGPECIVLWLLWSLKLWGPSSLKRVHKNGLHVGERERGERERERMSE